MYPATAHGNATVTLELLINTEGHVAKATVTQSAGPAFDRSATAAAMGLRFSPARRGSTAIPAVIAFSFYFEAPPQATPTTPGAPRSPAQVEAPDSPVLGESTLVVHGPPPRREPTRHTLAPKEVQTAAGTAGDVLRALENMPGVARPAWGSGSLVIRGSAPEDSLLFVEGAGVPFAYHLGEGSSVIPSDLLEGLDFYPGNFGPQFGRGMGGAVDIRLRSPRRDRVGARAQIDVLDARALVETPLFRGGGLLVGARRSWLDAWFGPVMGSTGLAVVAAPVYWDAQLVFEQDLAEGTQARLSVVAADDRLEVFVRSPSADAPAIAGNVGGGARFVRTQIKLDSTLHEQLHLTQSLTYGFTDVDQRFGKDYFTLQSHELWLRSELQWQLDPRLQAIAGLDGTFSRHLVDGRFHPYSGDDEFDSPFFGRPARSFQDTVDFLRPAGYLALQWTPSPGLVLIPSLRADYTGDTGQLTYDPRLSARYQLANTVLKAGLGLYHQPPALEESAEGLGTSTVRSNRAIHGSLGFEQTLAQGLTVGIDGFYKHLQNLVTAKADETRLLGARFTNQGNGYVLGGEALLRFQHQRFRSTLSYTLSRSIRRREPSAPAELAEFDQTHVLSTTAQLELGDSWSLGMRFRYVTGVPFSPYDGGLLDLDAGAYAPFQLSENRYSERLPDFHQLDLRLEKRWRTGPIKLAAYLEVRNAYNRRSIEDVIYNYNYSERTWVQGLPILPVLGFRGEL